MSKKGFLVPVVHPENEFEGTFRININGKLDKTEYEVYGGEMMAPGGKELSQEFLEKIMGVPCVDLPDGINIWIITEYELSLGNLGVFNIIRKGKKLKIDAWYCSYKEGDKKIPVYNPVFMQEAIARYSLNSVLRCNERRQGIEETDYTIFVYDTDTKGTVADKYNVIHDLLSKWSLKAKRELIAELKKFLNR